MTFVELRQVANESPLYSMFETRASTMFLLRFQISPTSFTFALETIFHRMIVRDRDFTNNAAILGLAPTFFYLPCDFRLANSHIKSSIAFSSLP